MRVCVSVCKPSLTCTWVQPVRAFSLCSVQFKLKQMFKSPSFQFLFAGLSLLQQLISLMSFLNSWLLANHVSAWKPVLSKGEGLGTWHAEPPVPSRPAHQPLPPHHPTLPQLRSRWNPASGGLAFSTSSQPPAHSPPRCLSRALSSWDPPGVEEADPP